MCWCRISLVLLGLLGLLCVVHVVSGTCGEEDIQASAKLSEVVLAAKIRSLSDPDPATGMYDAHVQVRGSVLKGKKLLDKGKKGKRFTLGPFNDTLNRTLCVTPVKKGKTYVFYLSTKEVQKGVKFRMIALPKKRNKKYMKKVAKALGCNGDKCDKKKDKKKKKKKKKKKTVAPTIRKTQGPKGTERTGAKLTFKCYARATPRPRFTWYKDGVLLATRQGLTIKSTRRYSRLQIRKAKPGDGGAYKCVATNDVGQDEKNFTSFGVRANPVAHRTSTYLCERQTLCLNGGTCMHNEELDVNYCICPERWTGTRCEMINAIRIHGHYNRQATLLYERTLIIVGLVIAVLVFIVICIASYFLAKRRRQKFEERKKKKQALRAKKSDSASPGLKSPPNYALNWNKGSPVGYAKPYQPTSHNTGSSFPPKYNGFDFDSAQQSQPLLRHHDETDGAGPESRRRLAASSMYENLEDQQNPNNRSANVTGLTTAEVNNDSEMIEMTPMESRASPATETTPGLGVKDDMTARPPDDDDDNGDDNNFSPPFSSSSSPRSLQPELPDSMPDSPQSPDPVAEDTTGDLDFEKYRAPPPPLPPRSNSNTIGLHHPPDTSGGQFVFPASNSMPNNLVSITGTNNNNNNNNNSNNINNNNNPVHKDSPVPNSYERQSPPPPSILTNHLNNSPIPPYRDDDPQQADGQDEQDEDFLPPPPPFEAALGMNGTAIGSDDDDDDDDDDDSDDDYLVKANSYGKPENNFIEDLHISEEDLGLSAENLLGSSFNSVNCPSRQTSIDHDGTDRAPTHTKPRRYSIEKQQSEDTGGAVPFWKRSLLGQQVTRSHSLDNPHHPGKVNGISSPNHLDSTMAGHQNAKSDVNRRNGGRHHNHCDDVFDPNDDVTPWDPEQQQSYNGNNYTNLLDEESDRLARLKDVCPDQSAIPI